MFWPIYAVVLVWTVAALHKLLSSPLASLPGPWYTKFTGLLLKSNELRAQRRHYIHKLHQKYGPVVRLAPNEVSFASLEGMKEIYTSGGSGYDKTNFYDLFKQYDIRNMFSTLGKTDHSNRKKLYADVYANSNILRPETLASIQERAQSFVRQCTQSSGSGVDVYVPLHCYALDCATHHLFHPYGSNSLDGGKDMELMRELSYHDSIRGMRLNL